MANSAQARKRVRQAEKNRQRNTAHGSRMRTAVKKLRNLVAEQDKKQAVPAYRDAVSLLDRVAGKGKIHKNKAARLKSRLNANVRALG